MAVIDNIIMTESSFIVRNRDAFMTSVKLNVWIYNDLQGAPVNAGTDATTVGGSLGRPADPTYTLTSTGVGNTGSKYVAFNLTNLVRATVDREYNGVYNDDGFATGFVTWFVDYQEVVTVNGVEEFRTMKQCLVYRGYGEYSEGYNFTQDLRTLFTGNTIFKKKGEAIRIPVYTDLLEKAVFYKGNTIVSHKDFEADAYDVPYRMIKYITEDGSIKDRFQDRIEDDSAVFEGEMCIEKIVEGEDYGIDKVVLKHTDDTTTEIKIVELSDSCHTPYKLTFINKKGALQDMWFTGSSKESIESNTKTYNRVTTDYSSSGSELYDTKYAQRYKRRVSSTKRLELNSGFYPESGNVLFEELMLSSDVWIEYEGQILPILIKTSTFNKKNRINDKAINYTVEVEFAFNLLNNI